MLQIREIQEKDLDQLTQIIREVWEMDQLGGGEEAGRYFSREYLVKTLNQSTSVQIAVLNGQVIGVIAIRQNKVFPVLSFPEAEIPTGLEEEAVQAMKKRMMQYEASCENLLRESGYTFEGEITLLAVSPAAQGQGIGMELFEKAREQFGRTRFFLYTDTGCSYGFYDRQGMKCLAKKQQEHPYQKKDPFFLFLYGNE